MRAGVIIGSALAGAAAGAIISMTAEDRRNATNYLSGLWDRVPSSVQDVLPKNLKNLNLKDLRQTGKAAVKTASRKTQRFANAGRTGDVRTSRGRKTR